MSLLNVWVTKSRAIVAVDTLAAIGTSLDQAEAGETKIHASKLLTLPHAGIVLACRGDQVVFGHVAAELHLSYAEVDMEFISSHLAEIMDSVVAQRPQFREAEIVAVGFSTQDDRIVGVVCERRSGDQRSKLSEVDPWRIGPNAGWSTPPALNNSDAMESVARQQVKFVRETHPGAAIGGRLIIAQVLPGQVSLFTACDLG